jgi:hypothetical protein
VRLNLSSPLRLMAWSLCLMLSIHAFAQVTLTPATVAFPTRVVGTSSVPFNVNLKNTGSAAITISNINITGVFSQTNTCASTLAAGTSCVISVTFTPTQVGAASGTLTVTDTATNSPQVTTLSGTGNVDTITALTISPLTPSIVIGGTQQFVATGTFKGGSTYPLTTSVTWSSSSTTVASISNAAGSQGLATAIATGSTTIKAVINSFGGSTLLSVTGSPLSSITVTPATATVPAGDTKQFTATGNYSDGSHQNLTSTATWGSSATAVATVHAGLAQTLTAGSTTISATSGSITGTAALTVATPVLTSIQVTPANVLLQTGATSQLAATGTYSDGSQKNVTTNAAWSSSNTTVATVGNTSGSKGLVTAVANGGATITAKVNAITGTASVTVGTPTVTVSPASFTMGIGSNLLFTATVSGNPNGAVTWQVNGTTGGNSTVGTIDTTGLYIAPVTNPNTAITITAVSQVDTGVSGTAAVTLTQFDPVGTATGTSITCPNIKNGVPGSCYSVDISCPGVADFTAYLKVTSPTGTPLGTVIYTVGAGGSGLYEQNFTYGSTAITNTASGGYTTVQTSFGAPFTKIDPDGWLTGPGGVRRLACRYITLSQWIYNNIHQGSTSAPLCATGNSGGAQAIGESMAHYNAGSLFAMVEPSSGPSFSNMVDACQCSAPNVALACAPTHRVTQCVGYTPALTYVDPAYPGPWCSTAVNDHDTLHQAEFLSDSIQSPDATLSYPNTYVRLLYGSDDLSSAPALGEDWRTEITSPNNYSCVAGTMHGIADTMVGAQQLASDMVQYCKLPQ